MKCTDFVCVCIISFLIVAPTVLTFNNHWSTNGPLHAAFEHFKEIAQDGCNIDVLPDYIEWCDGKLSQQGTLPDNSVCQSLSTDELLFLVCRNGRWVSRVQEPSTSNRIRKSINEVYQTEKNATCSRFCVDDETQFVGKRVPEFISCPASVSLYPSGNMTDILYTWEFPNATDADGTITSLIQIVGQDPNTTFESSSSPGTSHVVSYLATDNDNMNWTCSFVINTEIPTCPPIVHITDGNTSCTDYNNRDSECTFICNHGYQLNGSANATCMDNGNWSYAEDIPQCTVTTCSLPVIEPTNISSVLEVVCDNSTYDNTTDSYPYESICWLQCPNDYLLKNDVLQADILQQLSDILDDVSAARNLATEADQDANDAADLALQLANDFQDVASIAENNTNVIEGNLDMANSELIQLLIQYNETNAQMEQKLVDLEDDTLDTPFIEALIKEINTLNQTLIAINASIQALNIDSLTIQLAESQNTLETARENSDQAWIDADEAEATATEKEALLQEANDAYLLAFKAFYDAQLYTGSGGMSVSTYALCTADGTWMIPGNPYCEDIDPPGIKCLPVAKHYLNPGETSAVVTWNLPEVTDNSGNYILNISGPQPNDTLTRGQYIAEYRAADDTGNLSPLCQIVINVLVNECEDIDSVLDEVYMEATCENFELGTTCNLTCGNNYQLDGPSTVTCRLNTSTGLMYWDLPEAYCIMETCAVPADPINGNMECIEDEVNVDNTTDNSTDDGVTGIQCVAMCNEDYMLPYKTSSDYNCDEENGWDSEDFPSICIESGGEKHTKYSYILKHNIAQQPNCTEYDLDGFMDDLAVIIATEMPAYPACMNGYMCELGDMSGECSQLQNIVLVEFTIMVTCEGPITSIPDDAKCDLHKDGAKSFANSLNVSVEVNGVFDDLGITLTDEWLDTQPTVVPICSGGSILVGSYCARCAAGTFYAASSDQCIKCGVGAYTNTDGREECTTCPPGTSTLQRGSTQCIETCKPGTYSSTGLVPCATCIPGTYQSDEEATTCKTCPVNTWTTGEGSDALTDCIEYDIYFNDDVEDWYLTSVTGSMSAVFWMKYYYPTHVSLELLYDNGDSAFILDITEKPQLLYDNWDNEPLVVTMDTFTWIMFGITWDVISKDVTVYKDGERQLQISLSEDGLTDQLKLSASNKTLISGLSISNSAVSDGEMMTLYDDCGASLTDANYTLDNVAKTRHSAVCIAQSSCKSSPSDDLPDPCGLHECQHYGTCVPNNNSVGYTCACTEQYGGNFCEETMTHGNYSEWFYAAECSRTCGLGTRPIYRLCNNPSKSEYGNDCEGNSTEVIDCYLANCTECESPEIEGVTVCELEDDSCTATCPPGFVLPPGQSKQSFKCGKTTNYRWAPLHRLPICTESRQPKEYAAKLTFTFVDPVPCNVENDVAATMREIASNQQCLNDLPATCNVSAEILDCITQDNRRKRDTTESKLVITYVASLNSNVTFDLVEYYNTSVMTESILEAVTAIFVLEQTIQDILADPGMFLTVIGTETYTVVASSVLVETTTHCYPGQVPVEGVCAVCQRGTYEVDGWCVYCNRGSFQNLPGQSSCKACPNSQMTDFIGAREEIECIVIPEPPTETDYTFVIIIVVCIFLAILIILLVILLSRRFYLSAKDREKFDLEADRVSLYTDFPDISYNVFYRRKEVLGFDEQGQPIIGKTRFKNGPVPRPKGDNVSIDDGRSKEPFAYPEDGQEPPFTYDPYAMWTEDAFVDPYEYPEIDAFDFPKIAHAVRYRVPGRKHLQNAYPLTQFGYNDKVYGNHRKNIPLPVTIQIPKKLPQLMYRKPDTMSLKDILKSQFGFKKLREEVMEEGIEIDTKKLSGNHENDSPIPPLSLKKPDKKKTTQSKGRKIFTPIRMTRSAGARSPRTPKVTKARSVLKTKLDDRSPRAASASAFSPRSISIGSPSPRPSTSLSSTRTPRVNVNIEDAPHPKPSSYIVHKPTPNFATIPEQMVMPTRMERPQKSALRLPDEPRPDTGMTTGRKSVTIREDANITRPSTTATMFRPSTAGTMFRPSTAGTSPRDHQRPSTDAKSAMDTIVAPYSARPRSSYSLISDRSLPNEITEAYRPTSSINRPMTPADFHPRPVLHADVTVKRAAGQTMFFPPANIRFNHNPPAEHTMKQMEPPPFVNRVNPQIGRRQKRVRVDAGDGSNEQSGSFFLTDLPDELRTSRASILSKGSRFKKPSPPPDYSMSSTDKIIETSTLFDE